MFPAMNIIDWLIIGVAILSFAVGYRRGLVTQLLSLVGVIAALVAAFFFYTYLSPTIAAILPLDQLTENTNYEFLLEHFQVFTVIYNVLAFAVIFFVVLLGAILLKHFLNIVVKAPGLNLLNRWGGVVLSLLQALVITTLAIYLIMVLPFDNLQHALRESMLVSYLMQWPDWLIVKLQETEWIST